MRFDRGIDWRFGSFPGREGLNGFLATCAVTPRDFAPRQLYAIRLTYAFPWSAQSPELELDVFTAGGSARLVYGTGQWSVAQFHPKPSTPLDDLVVDLIETLALELSLLAMRMSPPNAAQWQRPPDVEKQHLVRLRSDMVEKYTHLRTTINRNSLAIALRFAFQGTSLESFLVNGRFTLDLSGMLDRRVDRPVYASVDRAASGAAAGPSSAGPASVFATEARLFRRILHSDQELSDDVLEYTGKILQQIERVQVERWRCVRMIRDQRIYLNMLESSGEDARDPGHPAVMTRLWRHHASWLHAQLRGLLRHADLAVAGSLGKMHS